MKRIMVYDQRPLTINKEQTNEQIFKFIILVGLFVQHEPSLLKILTQNSESSQKQLSGVYFTPSLILK